MISMTSCRNTVIPLSTNERECDILIARKICVAIIAFIILSAPSWAEIRTYRQFKDIAARENGKIVQSGKKGDLFEYTYDINMKNMTVTRIKVQRLDEKTSRKDATIYKIMQKKDILGSNAGNGGWAIVAVRSDGGETLELSHRFAFSTRVSPFSQVITGIYKRVYYKDRDRSHDYKKYHRKTR